MYRSSYVLFIFIVSCLSSVAQNIGTSYEFQSKYHMLDSAELYVPKIAGKAFTSTPPPTGTIRAIAEWEPAQAVLISYPGNFGIPYSEITELSETYYVITIVTSSSQQTTVTNNYNSNGVNLANCSFIIAPLNTYWTRDYGPWFIMTNNNTIAIVDFPYNRPLRTKDDNIPIVMASAANLNEPLYGMNVLHTGGNYMCDGMGVAAMTNLVEDENTSLSHAQIDTLFKQYMGITRNYITTDPLNDYIKHVDCWGKFLDVDKILIASVSTSNAQYDEYEAMAAYWANETSSYGNHYQVYRVYEPNGQAYTNSLIINKKVLVPIATSYGTTNNDDALAVYQQAMPGYEIIGITYTGWQPTDALHCRAHEIADKGMLYIKHLPLLGEKPIQTQYTISADIYALSGSNVIADSVWIKYRVNNASWIQLAMTNGSGNNWTANIPQQAGGDTIEYFTNASDLSPRNVTHPLIGQYDPHKFYLTAPTTVIEDKNKISAIVFPNPANNNLFVQMKDTEGLPTVIKLLDILGKKVKTITENNLGDKMLRINLSELQSGTYFVQIFSGSYNATKKIMVIH